MIIDVPWYVGTVRVAFNEAFVAEVDAETWLVDKAHAPARGSRELRRVWIEVVRSAGARTIFAMLGAERKPLSELESIIRVPVLEESQRRYASDLSDHLNAVVALSRSFADQVMEVAKRTIDRNANHELIFASAAQTDIGSSAHLFGQAAAVISALLAENGDLPSLAERVHEVVKREFK